MTSTEYKGESRPPHALVLVHGTFDASEDDQGPRWWQEGSAFDKHLVESIASAAFDAPLSVIRFKWNGQNSETSRNAAASDLAELIRESLGPECRTIILTHSHGGNVVRRALSTLGADFASTDIRVVSVATPFFEYGPPKSAPASSALKRSFDATLRMLRPACLGLVSLLPIVITIASLWSLFNLMGIHAQSRGYDVTWLAMAVVVSVSLLASPGAAAISYFLFARWFSKRKSVPENPPDGVKWEAIYSHNDEAMTLLNWIAKPRPLLALLIQGRSGPQDDISFRPGEISRIVAGVAVVSIAAFVPLLSASAFDPVVRLLGDLAYNSLALYAHATTPSTYGISNPFAAGLIIVGGFVLAIALLVVAAVGCVYLVRWVFEIPARLLAYVVRFPFAVIMIVYVSARALGRQGLGAGLDFLDGIVFRRISLHVLGDDCRAAISGVALTPWPASSRCSCTALPTELHDGLELHVKGHMALTGAKARDALSKVDDVFADRDWAALGKLMTWSELAHTAYFREPEVSRFILERLFVRTG